MKYSKECPYCGQGTLNKYATISVCKCPSCSLLFKNGLQFEGGFDELYKKAWQDTDNHKDKTGGTDLELARIYARKLVSVLGLKDFKGLKLLEFGAGRGNMLAALLELGANVYGVEPFGYEYLKNKGFKVFRTLEEIPGGILFDGIVTIDVIEHVLHPWDILNLLYGRLNSQGWFYVTTPNAGSLNARLSAGNWRELHNSSHIYFLDQKCLEIILNKIGLNKFIRLRWFVQYTNNPLRVLMHYVLQQFGLDGELRYLIVKFQ